MQCSHRHATQAEREQLTQLAFEEFNMTGFFLCDQPVCSLYAVGKITGTVVDLGYAKTGKWPRCCIQNLPAHPHDKSDLRDNSKTPTEYAALSQVCCSCAWFQLLLLVAKCKLFLLGMTGACFSCKQSHPDCWNSDDAVCRHICCC